MATKPKIVMPEDTISNKVKMLIYGGSGVGKTYLATTAPKPVVLAAEGLFTLRKYKIPCIVIDKWETLQNAHEWLKLGEHDYETVIVDSLNEVQFVNQLHLLETASHKRMTQGDWGDNILDLQKMVRAFRDLPMNVIFTCALDEFTSDKGLHQQPAISTKKLPNDILNIFDFVGLLVAQETDQKDEKGNPIIKRAIRFEPNETLRAKNRDGCLNMWEKPDFSAMHEKIFGKPAKA